jgi:hypothetical protein
MPLLETPSRVWRRIEDAQHVDMPSLPSLPAIDDITDDVDSSFFPHSNHNSHNKQPQHDEDDSLPVQATPPLPATRQQPASRRSSTGQTTSILSHGLNKSTRSTPTVRFADKHETFEISAVGTNTTASDFSGFHVPDAEPELDDINTRFISALSLPDAGRDGALEPVSRSHSPLRREPSSVGLRSDSWVRPLGV